MKTNTVRSLLLALALVGATLVAGCNADTLAGPEPVEAPAGGDGSGGESHNETDPRNL
jgi:hypothetical protein